MSTDHFNQYNPHGGKMQFRIIAGFVDHTDPWLLL